MKKISLLVGHNLEVEATNYRKIIRNLRGDRVEFLIADARDEVMDMSGIITPEKKRNPLDEVIEGTKTAIGSGVQKWRDEQAEEARLQDKIKSIKKKTREKELIKEAKKATKREVRSGGITPNSFANATDAFMGFGSIVERQQIPDKKKRDNGGYDAFFGL